MSLFRLSQPTPGAYLFTPTGEGPVVPAWVEALRAPSGDLPVAALDFKNGRYWAGAAEVAAAGVISDPTKIAAGGLVIAALDDAPYLIGDALTAGLAASVTTLIKFSTVVGGLPIVANNADDSEEAFYVSTQGSDPDFSLYVGGYDMSASWQLGDADDFPFTADTPQALAFTTTPTAQAASDGTTLVTDTTAVTLTCTQVIFGAFAPDGSVGAAATVTLLAFYAPQPNADLDNIANLP